MKIKIHLLDDLPEFSKAIPIQGSAGAGAYDLRLTRFEDEVYPTEVDSDGYRKHLKDRRLMLEPGMTQLVGLGFAAEIPKGYVALLAPRSGLGCKGIQPKNRIGVIDSDYRGEFMACLTNDTTIPYLLTRGERVVQMLVVRSEELSFDFVDALSSTQRAAGGFNSTGTK